MNVQPERGSPPLAVRVRTIYGAAMRVASLSPAATEAIEAMGLGARLVGRADALARSALGCAPAEPPERVDLQVRDAREDGTPIVTVDEGALAALAPDVVVTAFGVGAAARPDAFSLDARSLADGLDELERLGAALDAPEAGHALRASLEARLARLARPGRERAACLALVWADPPWVASGLAAELLAAIGAEARLTEPGAAARLVDGRALVQAEADRVLLAPCGYRLEEAAEEARRIAARPEAQAIGAVARGELWALEAPRSIVSWVGFAEAAASVLDGAPAGAIRAAPPPG